MNQPPSTRLLQAHLLLGHFIFALFATTLQPMLPAIQQDLGLTIFQSSSIPTLMTGVLAVTNITVGVFIGKTGIRTMYGISGIIALLASPLGFFSRSFPGLLLGFMLFGMAIGAAFTSLATMYSHIPREKQNFGMFHAAFGLGGIISPLILNGAMNTPMGYRGVFLLYFFLALVNLLILLVNKEMKSESYTSSSPELLPASKIFKNPLIVYGVLMMGVYAAGEIGTVTYAGNFNISGYSLTLQQNSLLLSLFWIFFTLSRLFTDPMLRRWNIQGVGLYAGLGGSLLIGLWVGGFGSWIFPGLGLILGPVFPAVQKYATQKLNPESRGLFNGAAYGALGIVTSLTLPVMGSISEVSLHGSFLVPVILFLFLGILGFRISKLR